VTDEHGSGDDRAEGEDREGENRETDDETIRVLVARLSRPHRSGGRVIERASLLASGADFEAAMSWIEAHGGQPEAATVAPAERGLHSPRLAQAASGGAKPLRFILPASSC